MFMFFVLMWGFLSVRGTFLLLFVGLVLVNRSVVDDHVLWSIRIWGSPAVFLLQRKLRVWECTLRDSSAGQDFWDTFGETDIDRFGVSCCNGRSSSPSLRDVQGRVALLLDASPKIDPWWLRRHRGSGVSAEWSYHPPSRLGMDSAEGARIVASWKHPARNPGYWRKGLPAAASIFFCHRCD